MIISDLNYLEANEDAVFGGLLIVPNRFSSEVSRIDVRELVDINKFVRSDAIVRGNLGTAQANVVGFSNSLTEATSYVSPGLNSSSAISAGNS